ncbi:unnamed protein product [Polarella glacialis]|uniref:Uncharacterized protein n=1 Tax=Polarella glacialis TaxID=89957 RepID=A0A813KA85_POLGL|nr:unnamed protein product [Polarella glacialis]
MPNDESNFQGVAGQARPSRGDAKGYTKRCQGLHQAMPAVVAPPSDAKGYTLAIGAAASRSSWQQSLALVHAMPQRRVAVNIITLNAAASTFSRRQCPLSYGWLADDLRCQGARPAVVGVEGALVGACAAGAQWQPALRLIGDLLNSQQEPDAASVGAATSACRRARQWESAISLLADACEAAPVGEAPLARLLEDLDRQRIAPLLVHLGLGGLQVGLGACSRRRGRVVQAIAVEVLEPAADLPVPSKDWASLLSQAEFVASASFPPEVPPKPSAPVPVAKVLVEFPADPDGFFWHHRILLKRIAGPTWLALTPDHDICRHNLETSRHLVLERAAQFPAAQRAFVYAFDPIDRATLEGFKRIAATQAALLGDGGDVEAKGIVKIGNEEVFVEKVQADQLAAWAAKTVKDAGDIRLLGDHRDAAGKRKLDLSSAVAMMRESKIDDFPLQGVRACREYLSAISEGPGNIVSYHSEWVRLSGVNEASAVDLSNMAGGEQLVRWIIQIETAVERNPKLPDFSGLDIVTGATTTAEGKALAPKFGEWITERMKSRATIWKSQRQYNEERRGSAKVKGDGKGGKGAQAAADKDRDGKKKKKDAGGAQAAADDQRATMEATGKRNTFSSPAFGVRARDRRHGDPFPLPVPSSHSALFRAANTGQRQVFEAFLSLNALAGPTLKSASAQQHSLPPSAGLKPTSVQQWMMDDVVERISRHGSQPADLSEESSLGELLASSGPYSGDVGHLAAFDISKIKVLSRPLRPQEAASLCPPRTAGYYKHFRHVIERDERELEVLRESNYDGLTPYWDPKLKRSRGTRIGLYQALHRVGLLTFRRRAKAKVGFFVVAKKDGMQRLIVDARVPNMCHRRPPPTRLGTSGAYLDLDLGDHAASGFGPVYEPSGNEGDVGDCFYNFLQEDLASWFCADDWMTSEEWMSLGIDVGEVFDDELRCKLCPSRDERLCPAFLGVCMGWSWALHMAQEIVSHQVSQTENFDKSDQIRDKQVAPLLQPGRPVLGIYVDNVAIIGGVPEDADRRMRAVCERFGQLGIPFVVTHKSSQSYLDTIGLRFDFARRALMHKSRRCWRLRLATLALLRRRKVRGSVLQVWGGHVIHHFSLLRPGMSCLHSFYRFIEFAGNEQKVLWPSVRQEMRLVIGLVFLGEAHLGAPIHENVYLGDSSTYGFSLMVTKSSQLEVRQATLHRERWRFIVPDVELGAPLVSPLDFSSLGGLSPLGGDVAPPPGLWPPGAHEISSGWSRGSCPGAGFGTSTQYGRQLLQQAELRRKPVQSWRPSRPPRPLVEVPDSIPVIGPEWDKRDRYTLLVAAPWHHTAEHINIKEMRVLLMGVRRCCRDRSALGHRVLLLSDNLVSVLALEKGRSSSYSLNLLCRRAAAYSIGGRISFRFRHIGTDRNVADAPSRCIPDNAQTHLAQLGLHRWVLGVGLEARIRGRLRWANLQGLQLGGQLHASRRRTSQQPKYFLELFSGSGVLTTAFKQAGCNVLPACEILNGVQFDLTRHSTQEALLRLLRTGRIWYVHMGTPCTVWSRARHGLTNMARARAKETVGVELALFSVAVARLASSLNIWWSIENPRSSRLWNFHPVSELLQLPHTHWFHWDMCMYDSPNKKPTATMTNCPSLAGLARACQGGHKHMVLRGTERVRLLDGLTVTRNKTAGAGVYPVPLCRRWCSLATSLCPAGAFGDSSSGFKGESDSALSHAARAASSSVHGLAMPHEQTQKRADHDFLGNPCYRAQRYREPIIFGQHSNAEAESGLASSSKRGRVLCAKTGAGVLLQRSKQLKCRKVTSNTLARYSSALEEFDTWAKKNKRGVGPLQLDASMVEFMQQQYETPEEKLFPSLSLASYERLFQDARRQRYNKCIHVTPHSVRHSGPSNDKFHKRRSLLQIQKRCQWASSKSVTKYEKEALPLGIWRAIPENQHSDISAISREFPSKLFHDMLRVRGTINFIHLLIGEYFTTLFPAGEPHILSSPPEFRATYFTTLFPAGEPHILSSPPEFRATEEFSVPQNIYLSWVRQELDDEQACLELPFTILLLMSFAFMAVLGLSQDVVFSVEQAIEQDIVVNANFAFSHNMGHKGLEDAHSFADIFSWLRLGFLPLVIQPSWSYSESRDADSASVFDLTNFTPSDPSGSWAMGAYGPSTRTLPMTGDYLHYNRIVGGLHGSALASDNR